MIATDIKRICKVSLEIEWDDGLKETMYESLPEYLYDEINTYLNELELHRAEVQEDYNTTQDKGENNA